VKIILQTVSDLAGHFGGGELEIEFSGATLHDLLRHIKAHYGYDLESQKHTMLFLNGRGCVDFESAVSDGDRVAIVPVMAAG
jgi:molybdopterin converting factor small subunit